MSSSLNFHLEHYEGPLDLLLDLIRKQEINIYDIPIAQITTQYLEFMQRAIEMDIELSAEFVYMAATLIHIKSRMLLPRTETPAADEGVKQIPVGRVITGYPARNSSGSCRRTCNRHWVGGHA